MGSGILLERALGEQVALTINEDRELDSAGVAGTCCARLGFPACVCVIMSNLFAHIRGIVVPVSDGESGERCRF